MLCDESISTCGGAGYVHAFLLMKSRFEEAPKPGWLLFSIISQDQKRGAKFLMILGQDSDDETIHPVKYEELLYEGAGNAIVGIIQQNIQKLALLAPSRPACRCCRATAAAVPSFESAERSTNSTMLFARTGRLELFQDLSGYRDGILGKT
jgi:hypothetical protein